MPQLGKFIDKFVLSEVEVRQVAELVVADKFVERIYMMRTYQAKPNPSKVFPLVRFGSQE
jgi:hypothetical protein